MTDNRSSLMPSGWEDRPPDSTSPASAEIGSPRVPPERQQTVISKQPPITEAALVGPRGSSELGRALEGERLGHFELREFVGGGGMGAVFRAFDTQLGRTVAVKVISREQSADEETRRRFRNEAQSAARLDHENTTRVYYVGEDDGWNYIVFEFVDGENIRDLVEERGALPLGEAVNYTLQIAEALAHAFERDVVHRDIKPSNVLIMRDGHAKLVDMGLARLRHVESSGEDLTASGVTLGTFDYISPEQARDPRSADVRSDLYSLGCTFYFMLTGRPPYPDGTALQKLLSHSGDAPPDPRQILPQLPDEIAEIVIRMLAKKSDHRYQRPNELIGELLLVARRLGLDTGDRDGTIWISEAGSRLASLERHVPWVVPVVILILVVLALDIIGPRPYQTAATPPPPPVRGEPAESNPSEKPLHKSPSSLGSEGPGEVPGLEPSSSRPNEAAPDALRVAVNGTGNDELRQNDLAEEGFRLEAPRSEREVSSQRDAVEFTVERDEIAFVGGNTMDTEPRGTADVPRPSDQPVVAIDDGTKLIVGDGGEATLAAACSKARQRSDLDTIELRYSGARVEKPFSLANLDLTIRAARGFAPIVLFQPEVGDEVAHPRQMISVSGGELTLKNVHFQLDVPPEPVDRWALFELQQVELLRIIGCTMTIRSDDEDRSAFAEDVAAFLDIRPAPGHDMGMGDDDRMVEMVTVVRLRDCVARGAATLLRMDEVQPLRFSWDNGLLATTRRLLSAAGSPIEPLHGETVGIDLDHVTAVMHGGMCLLTRSGLAPYQLTANVTCKNCILMTDDQSPLIRQRGEQSVDEFRRQFFFNGERNFYENRGQFWRIEALNEDTIRDFNFSAWTDYWMEELPVWDRVQWRQLPPSSRPVYRHTPADYHLTAHPSNPARGSARDESDAGFRAELLPKLPPIGQRSPPPGETGTGNGFELRD